MTLAFPNPSCSFDKTRNAVRFTGYDGMFEAPFFVEVGALGKSAAEIHGASGVEAMFLSAFNARRTSIHDAARAAYSRGRRPSYTLTAADVR